MRTAQRRPKQAETSQRQTLMKEGQPIVISLATKISRTLPVCLDLNDLIAFGQVGLAQAAKDYNPNADAKFTTYAFHRVRGAIYDGVSKMSWTSRTRYRRLRRLEEESENATNAAENADGEIQEPAENRSNRFTSNAEVILASDRSDQEDSEEFADDTARPITILANREVMEMLREIVDELPPQPRKLIRLIYFEGAKLTEAATQLGLSKSWASRLHARTLNELGVALQRMGAAL